PAGRRDGRGELPDAVDREVGAAPGECASTGALESERRRRDAGLRYQLEAEGRIGRVDRLARVVVAQGKVEPVLARPARRRDEPRLDARPEVVAGGHDRL